MLSTKEIGGKVPPAATIWVEVQVKAADELLQLQPAPLTDAMVRPTAGRVSATVTVPEVEATPLLVTTMV